MKIEVVRQLPKGNTSIVLPYHLCSKGLEDAVLCRTPEDYDMLVKIIFLAAWAKNVIVVIYTVLSNHYHVVVLAASDADADACGEEIKRRYSMWLSRKYGKRGMLNGVETSALIMTDRWHVRNALAYVPRNALDNGADVNTYKWSGYRGMFCREGIGGLRGVASLSRREVRKLFHTADDLKRVPWRLNGCNELEPLYCCDHAYLEQAFEGDQAFFLKTLGALNVAEMRYSLEEKPFNMVPDTELLKSVNDISMQWFGRSVDRLPAEKKYRLLPYIYRTRKTTVSQLARAFAMPKDLVEAIVRKI